MTETATTSRSLDGARIAFAGRLARMSRREAQVAIRQRGAVPASAVTRRTTHLVVGSARLPVRADGRITRSLERAERLRSEGVRIEILPEQRFMALLRGESEAHPPETKTYSLEQVADLVGVDPTLVVRWEEIGLIRSADGMYDFQDIVSLRNIASLVQGGAPLETIISSLGGLSTLLPEVSRPLAQLQIVESGPEGLLAQVGETLMAPDGQHYFDFEADPVAAAEGDGTEPAGRLAEMETAETHFERGLDLEDDGELGPAAAAYRQALRLQPDWADAYFNLGNVLRAAGRHEGAEEMFRLALIHDPDNELAWYNLADALIEQDCPEIAASCLSRALERRPDFADAHFNLASCLDELKRHDLSASHWRAYLALDPGSRWSAIARQSLRRLTQ